MGTTRKSCQGRVLVVGAGLGGLACAIVLAAAGLEVTVLERAAASGGKMRQTPVGDATIDAGPTVLTLRSVFDALFETAGESLDDALVLTPCDTLARHAWTEDARLDLYADIARSADAIGAFAGAAEARGYLAFCAEARGVYETLNDTFMAAQQTSVFGLTGRVGLTRPAGLLRIRPFETLWRALGGHFADPRLRQLFGRYATYCGASPFAAPATLMLIAHAEQAGVWRVEGGMQRIAEALEALARRLGVGFRHGAHVERIATAAGRASGVELACGERLAAGTVIVNADCAALAAGLLGPEIARAVPQAPREARSLSAVTFALTARTDGFPLERHNVFFSSDYPAEFEDILTHRRLPRAPTVYVCAQDRPGAADGAGERLLVLVNAPADGDLGEFDEETLTRCETELSRRLAACGLVITPTAAPVVTTPAGFERLFPGTGGALYGRAMHGWAAAFRRPGARTRIPGLYLAGGGAHPGAGAPMAVLSGRLAAEALLSDLASTRRWVRGATPGGTSTRSAKTAPAA
jgi:1-hydroxycarotenoid 3,4-desaturase